MGAVGRSWKCGTAGAHQRMHNSPSLLCFLAKIKCRMHNSPVSLPAVGDGREAFLVRLSELKDLKPYVVLIA